MVTLNPGKFGLAQTLIKEGLGATKQISIEFYNYDFISLMLKLVIFFIFSYAISKIFEAIIVGGTVLNAFTGIFGIKLPSSLPQPITTFFTVGFHGFKFWDIIKVVATLMIIVEAFIYIENQKRLGGSPSPSTLAVFGVLIAGLSLITFPEIIQKVKEMRVVNQ